MRDQSASPCRRHRSISAVGQLRDATRPYHARVDAAYGGFDLTKREDYSRFLTAHAHALPGVEALLTECATLPQWHPRSQLLRNDLVAMGLQEPPLIPFALPDGLAARWGALYVLEGSRLGGTVLHRETPAYYPRTFLAARHVGAEWRNLLGKIEFMADANDSWIEGVIDGARACFELYLHSAQVGIDKPISNDRVGSQPRRWALT